MLFLWSKEPAADPKASPWFAWFATAVILWRCRRRITKAILAVSPFRLFKRRMVVALLKERSSSVIMKPKTTMTTMTKRTMTAATMTMTTRVKQQQQQQQYGLLRNHHFHQQLQQQQQQQQQKEDKCKNTATGIKTRVKRLCTGDGPHIFSSSSSVQTSNHHQVNYRVTRSGRVYGKYHNRILPTETIC
ncbi:probable serine/threonine-protein kinase MARK-A isoform X1 [Polistes fuscatus]|nr:probable serine/threonine-protein kinase MARK-A isoform X1 [Polistes fuscatus]